MSVTSLAANQKKRAGIRMVILGCCLLSIISVKAQTEQGRFTVGGSTDISEVIQKGNNSFSLSLAPSIGVFVIKNLAIGGRYSFVVGSSTVYNSTSQTSSQVTTFTSQIGPTVKYYLGKKALKGAASVTASYVVFTALENGGLSNYNGFSVGGTLGMAYFFNHYISLEMAGYITTAGYQGLPSATRTGLSLGLYAFLDKKKKE